VQQALTRAETHLLRDELVQQGPALLRLASALAALSLAVFALVDPAVARGSDLFAAQVVRIVACAVLLLVFGATFVGSWAVRWARAGMFGVALVTGYAVVAVTYATGGGLSDYHEALHVAMYGFAMLPIPWGRFDLPIVFGSYIVAYNLTQVLGDRTGGLGLLATHNGVLAATATIASVLQVVLHRQRLRDFLSRRALATANDRLKSLDAAKSRFFSNISHELRTPLTLIVAPLEALLESTREPLSGGQRERLRLAQRNALRLLRLVDDLLSLSKAEAASLKVHVSRLDLGATVRSFARDVGELAARKNIEVTVEVPDAPAVVEADPTLIERILLNVFGNAAKFVAIGGRITLRVLTRDDGVEIAVADNGVGISASNLPHIFDRFYQADNGSTRATGGTGIGLSLVKEISELHGGHVRAESTPGVGTTIACWFPATLPPQCEVNAIRTTEAGADPQGLPEWHQAIRTAKSYRLQGIDDATERRVAPRPKHRGNAPTILVVEDNPDMIRFLVALMAYEYNVLSAQNGRDGLKMALERRPDLIISDVMMPEMDGFEMVRRLREHPSGAQIPLIFLTARGSSEDRIAGRAGGADTYLPKPFRSEELLAAVDSLLARQATLRDSAFSREDEAVVFMASGLVEQLGRVTANLRRLQGLVASPANLTDDALSELAVALGDLTLVTGSLKDLSEAGVSPVRVPITLGDALRKVAQTVTRDAPGSDAVLLDLDAPMHVPLTEAELQSILAPLLLRALAVTPRGRNVHLQAQRRRLGHGQGSEALGASIILRDEGPALSPDQIERFFFPFGGSESEDVDGLATARARRIVLARGGSIAVELAGDLGTRVTIHLPVIAPVAVK
jgi:signal transduction histidine kinase